MGGIEIGAVCIKTHGREAGKKVVIIEIDGEKNFAVIDGKNVKRRKCNLRHLVPTNEKIGIKKGASHAEVISHFK